MTKPSLAFVPIHDTFKASERAASRKSHPLCDLGKGFIVIYRIYSLRDASLLHEVLSEMCAYTLDVDDYVNGRPEAKSLEVLADARNSAQHSLLSLIPHVACVASHHGSPLYHLCHLAALIYSSISLFPLPAITAPFSRLARQIKRQLSKPTIQKSWNDAPDLMMWIIFMAAIASVGMIERSWYVSTLSHAVGRLHICSWDDMRARLQGFLWYGPVSDVDGKQLWTEIEQVNPSTNCSTWVLGREWC